MSDLHSLLWSPDRQELRHVCGELPSPDPEALVLHRSLGPGLGLRLSYAQIGASLLSPSLRPAHGVAVRLLWLPLVPSKCLLSARDSRRVMRVVRVERSDELSSTLEGLEGATAWAFEEALDEPPKLEEVRGHVSAALEHATRAIAMVAEQRASRPFWVRRERARSAS